MPWLCDVAVSDPDTTRHDHRCSASKVRSLTSLYEHLVQTQVSRLHRVLSQILSRKTSISRVRRPNQ
jgi:hypothetical protein